MRVGIHVTCARCGRMKQPIGRSASLAAGYCNGDCTGYLHVPLPGTLWPGETEEQFGYPVGVNGTEER